AFECGNVLLMSPPIIGAIAGRIERDHTDVKIGREHAMQHPAHAARRKDLRRHDDAAEIMVPRPVPERERLFMRIPQRAAKDLDCACGYSKAEKDCLTVWFVDQNLLDQPLSVVLRGR